MSSDHRLLAAVSGTDQTQLDDALQQLEQAELVFRSGAPPEATYTFKHALVRDTAYQSLLKSRRQQIHGRIAAALEAEFADIAETEPETVAQHYTLAGLAAQAVPWWLKAGQRAMTQVRQPRGCGSLRQRARACRIPARFRDPLEAGAFAADRNGLGADPRQRLGRSGGPAGLFDCARTCRTAWGQSPAVRRDPRRERLPHHLGRSARRRNSRHAVPGRSAWSLRRLPAIRLRAGGAPSALGRQLLSRRLRDQRKRMPNQGMATYDYERHRHLAWGYAGHDPGVCCRSFSAQMLCICGKPDSAIQRSREAIALAERDSHPVSLAQAQLGFSVVHLMRREPAEGRRWAEKAIALCTEFAMPLLLGQARVFFGWALAGVGQLDEGIRADARGDRERSPGPARDMGTAYYLCALARACGEHGEASEGLAAAGAGVRHARQDRARRISCRSYCAPRESCCRRWTSRRCRRRLVPAIAGGSPRAGREILRTEGRASARPTLCRSAGAMTRHETFLRPVYAGFSEGFDTPDLVEAKGLLQKLSHSTAPRRGSECNVAPTFGGQRCSGRKSTCAGLVG